MTENPGSHSASDVDLSSCFLEAADGSASYITKCIDDFVNNRPIEGQADDENDNESVIETDTITETETVTETIAENEAEAEAETEAETETETDFESDFEPQEENMEEGQDFVESGDDETDREL